MAITLATAGRNAAANGVADLFDGAAGEIEILDDTTVLATIALPNPAFSAAGATVAGQVDQVGTWEDTSADATGTADGFNLKTNAGTLVLSGTVTATSGGGDIELNSVSLTAGDDVELTNVNIVIPAS
jgi:hypothetical protein